MKKIITLAVLLMTAVICPAQQKNGGKSQHEKEGFKRMQSEKIGFLTAELDLTPEEAQVFFPVYNQYTRESMEAHKATMNALWAMKDKKGEVLSDSETESRINAFIVAQQAEQTLMNSYFEKFKKVLPIQKVADLYLAEEMFRIKMIKQLQEPGQKDGQMHDKPANPRDGNFQRHRERENLPEDSRRQAAPVPDNL